jgi:hypothetical protein
VFALFIILTIYDTHEMPFFKTVFASQGYRINQQKNDKRKMLNFNVNIYLINSYFVGKTYHFYYKVSVLDCIIYFIINL